MHFDTDHPSRQIRVTLGWKFSWCMAHFKKENHYLSNVPDANLLKANDVLKLKKESIKESKCHVRADNSAEIGNVPCVSSVSIFYRDWLNFVNATASTF